MAIITESIVDIGTHGTFNIGLSKNIGEYTEDEIFDYAYCSSDWRFFRHLGDQTYNDYIPGGAGEPHNLDFPLKFVGRSGWGLNYDPGEIEHNQPESGLYNRIIWLWCNDTVIENYFSGKVRSIVNAHGVKIVTQMDYTKCRLHVNTFDANNLNYLSFNEFKIIEQDGGQTYYEHPRNCSVFPAVMFKWNGKMYIFRLGQDGYAAYDWSWYFVQNENDKQTQGYEWSAQPLSFDKTTGLYLPLNINRDFRGLYPGSNESHHTNSREFGDDVTLRYNFQYGYHTGGRINPNKPATYLEMASWYGCMFEYEGVQYKPLIQDGYVTGYTSDMTAESEFDNYTGISRHDVPPVSPSGGGDDDQDSDWDNIAINGAGIGGGSAFCRFYYCTEAELANLRTWTMGLSSGGDTIPGGFDPKSNIIGLTVFPFTISGNGPTTIKFTTNGGQDPITQQPMPRVVDSGVSCEGGAGATTRILNATIDVPATMKNRGEPWLDYESYIELFIPMCGIYQVDPQVVIGHTIHIEIFLDPVSGTVMGIAWVSKENGKCVVAQGSGTPGVQIPVAVGNYGLAQAARVQNTLSGFGNTASSAITNQVISNAYGVPGQVSPTISDGRIKMSLDTSAKGRIGSFNNAGRSSAIGFSGLISSINHWVSARQIANSPGTSASGGFSGSMAEWCGVFTPYVKIIRPKFRKPLNYKHTCGEPEVSARKLNSVGYAICINPDVSGLTNATETERMAIYQFLSTGVYYK